MGFLSPDSKFMQGLSNLIDAVVVNILMLITSIPLVTIGASLAAGHDAIRRSIQGEGGGATRNYCRAFASNFVKATILWLPYLLVACGLLYAWVVLQITPLLIAKFALTMLWLIGFEWTFALQARFENPVTATWKNAFVFGVTKFAVTLAMLAIDAVFLGLLVASWFLMPQGLFLLVVLGYGTMIALHIPLLEHALRPYLR
ncbi:DUF624 domain-containing protein [Bifidobacterium oedipodis]|uniref:Beta-carotene 15,15'-monooxygenase n=1 Tax=Bifidobacterium oedipodis TaxID=2675322 RepID=A0A7Y0ERE3_9BIFI|nr:DUF624 domain-containing protein [Bifidobacterium sp. DSM 109957]NMM94959.1 beta-carotene 15,15'-monooxygenase [Bifidobacterium sp. DSM 109957]